MESTCSLQVALTAAFTCGPSIWSKHVTELFLKLILFLIRSLVFLRALQAQSKLGGEGLTPFYGLLDGGREGDLFKELEDYFYYAQLRQ